jgi:predicted CoA-binding protein
MRDPPGGRTLDATVGERRSRCQRRIAVAGVSRNDKEAANLIYRRLREHGYRVFAVNPNAASVEGDPCFPDVKSLPEHVDGVVVATTPEVGERIVADCAEAGIQRVWLHRGIGPGSVSDAAVAFCHEHGIAVIPGGCPNMFAPLADPAHKCMRGVLRVTGKLPREVTTPDGAAEWPGHRGPVPHAAA